MILAEKITDLRKKAGWSQEELAEQLGVSRQSVSKWEGGQSLPDMDKIVRMSNLFGVSTDYLLKDEISELDETPLIQSEEGRLRRVTMEEASRYMEIRAASAPRIALSSMLCVASPVIFLALIALSESPWGKLSENAAVGIGICITLVMVAIAVMGFMKTGAAASDFAFLEKEAFETEYGVTGVVKKRKEDFREQYTRTNTISTVICILSIVPLFICICFNAPDFAYILCVCFILLAVSVATYGYVRVGTVMGSYDKLLEEGDFTRSEKSKGPWMSGFSTVYWLTATALFLALQFLLEGTWDKAWIVWPIAGVLYGAVRIIFSAIRKK